jgi:hypothetical protein
MLSTITLFAAEIKLIFRRQQHQIRFGLLWIINRLNNQRLINRKIGNA